MIWGQKMKLDARLAALATLIPVGRTVADIGTDHAYLPIYLIREKECPWAIACDINPGPLTQAQVHAARYAVSNHIDFRLGDGLRVVKPGEVEYIVIAGMGGVTIRDILAEQPAVARAAKLILQPMTDVPLLREWLVNNHYRFVDEKLAMDGKFLYQIMLVEDGQEQVTDPLLFELGPRLAENGDPLFPQHLQRTISRYERMLAGLERQNKPETAARRAVIRARLAQLGEMQV